MLESVSGFAVALMGPLQTNYNVRVSLSKESHEDLTSMIGVEIGFARERTGVEHLSLNKSCCRP